MLELENFIAAHNQPSYRFRQVASWLYAKHASDFESMTDLPLDFRRRLADSSIITAIAPVLVEVSKIDGTRKFLFELSDGELIESVLMRNEGRSTLCISTQVGCPLDCVFCQTGKSGFSRNLTSGEILDQVCLLSAECSDEGGRMNIVFMGMGEPLLNYREIVKSIKILNDPLGVNLSGRRITLSTAGIPRRIRELASEDIQCMLAVSLNAADDAKRRELMPAVSRYTIKETLEAVRFFAKTSGRRVTLEYVLLKDINTSRSDSLKLAALTGDQPFKINLIPYNPGGEFKGVTEKDIDGFIKELLPKAPAVTVRRSKGTDINAACGQLWTESLRKKNPAKGSLDFFEEEQGGRNSFRRKNNDS